MYLFTNEINQTNFFKIERSLVYDKYWANIPSASKTIYPTIGVHCNKIGTSFPSQETIAVLSGCTMKTVRAGIEGLRGFPGFSVSKRATKRGKWANTYHIEPVPQDIPAVWFYKAFFEGGNWCQLRPGSKAVYVALLAFSYFDFDIYIDLIEDPMQFEVSDFYFDNYQEREFDLACPEHDLLAEFAGVSESTVSSALDDLEECEFLQWSDSHELWKVFRLPPTTFKVDYLNESAQP